MTLDDVKALLPLLNENRVSKFRYGGLEVELHGSRLSESLSNSSPHTEPLKDELIDVPETLLPPDIRTDAINNVDAILNWSASPAPIEQLESPMPLTGEESL